MKTFSSSSVRCLSMFLIGLAIVSCKKNSQPEEVEPGSGKISYFAAGSGSVAKAFASKSIDPSTTVGVTWSSASVYVDKISFVGSANSLLDTTIAVEKKLNILSANALAGVIKLPAGSYKNVKVKLFCLKSMKSELAFHFMGTFTNFLGGTDSVLVGSSYPFEANLSVQEMVIDPAGNYKATFNFDLDKVLTGISTSQMESARKYVTKDGKKIYTIYKGGSADEPFYDQVIRNWQTVASVIVTKEST
jgi:hypothetical protein